MSDKQHDVTMATVASGPIVVPVTSGASGAVIDSSAQQPQQAQQAGSGSAPTFYLVPAGNLFSQTGGAPTSAAASSSSSSASPMATTGDQKMVFKIPSTQAQTSNSYTLVSANLNDFSSAMLSMGAYATTEAQKASVDSPEPHTCPYDPQCAFTHNSGVWTNSKYGARCKKGIYLGCKRNVNPNRPEPTHGMVLWSETDKSTMIDLKYLSDKSPEERKRKQHNKRRRVQGDDDLEEDMPDPHANCVLASELLVAKKKLDVALRAKAESDLKAKALQLELQKVRAEAEKNKQYLQVMSSNRSEMQAEVKKLKRQYANLQAQHQAVAAAAAANNGVVPPPTVSKRGPGRPKGTHTYLKEVTQVKRQQKWRRGVETKNFFISHITKLVATARVKFKLGNALDHVTVQYLFCGKTFKLLIDSGAKPATPPAPAQSPQSTQAHPLATPRLVTPMPANRALIGNAISARAIPVRTPVLTHPAGSGMGGTAPVILPGTASSSSSAGSHLIKDSGVTHPKDPVMARVVTNLSKRS